MGESADFLRGRELLGEGRALEALQFFERCYETNPEDPAYESYYGLVIGLERGLIKKSVALCENAISRDPSRAELYLNLARLHVKARDKRSALDTLRKGLRQNPDDRELLAMIRSQGVRRRPVFPCLKRSNPLNKYLGMLLHRLGI